MTDYPRFPKLTPRVSDTSETFEVGEKNAYTGATRTQTTSYTKANDINNEALLAVNKMEQWADSLNDKLATDQVQMRNTVKQDQFNSISIEGRIQLNSNFRNPDTVGPFQKGQIRFNASTNKFQGYDGTAWRDFH
tara:strand:+ start:3509 stop:3913 length:405 start_codon:yes stop_codon:yes gene_type:complete